MPSRSEPDLLRRKRAVDATMGKYRNRVFSWEHGVTCVHMARFHLRKLGHHPEPLPRVRSLIGANRALKERGWDGMADMLDAQPGLFRIPPAMMLAGDLAVVPADLEMGAILICAGPHKLMGWREDAEGMVLLDVPFEQLAAVWKV